MCLAHMWTFGDVWRALCGRSAHAFSTATLVWRRLEGVMRTFGGRYMFGALLFGDEVWRGSLFGQMWKFGEEVWRGSCVVW